MKNINNLISIALKSLLKNKRRNFLTVFGIIIGISSVITIMSIGNGFKKETLSQINENGGSENTALISYAEDNPNAKSFPVFQSSDLSLAKKVDGVKGVNIKKQANEDNNVHITNTGQKTSANASKKRQATGVDSGYGFDSDDNDLKRKIVTIDNDLNKKVFDGEGLHKTLFIENQGFKVVGITPPGELSQINIPTETFNKYFPNMQSEIPQLKVTLNEDYNKKEVGKNVAKVLNKQGSAITKGKYQYSDPEETAGFLSKILDGITYFIAAVAGISLFISGVGVMNVMYISVSERTEEIAIRRAFGAKAKDIEIQFLIESIVLCVIGGVIGLILGIIFSQCLALIPVIKSSTTIWSVLLCMGVSMFIGILFGWIPAKSAARKELIKIIK